MGYIFGIINLEGKPIQCSDVKKLSNAYSKTVYNTIPPSPKNCLWVWKPYTVYAKFIKILSLT